MRISDRSNLLVKVYVIGYSEKGESILICLTDKGENDRLIYSIVIDSFKYKGEHKTIELLNDYGIKEKKLNMLVWSHPDLDHTFGIDQILNFYCNEDTCVVLPYDVNGEAWNKVNYNKSDKDIIKKILGLTKRKFKSHETASVFDTVYQPMRILTLEDGVGKLKISLHALTPHSSRINYFLETHTIMGKNDLSIAVMMEIGNRDTSKFLFMADAVNDEIDMLYPEALLDPLFIKIPHHSSDTSDHMPDKLTFSEDTNPIACTTIFKSQCLPEEDVLRKYMDKFSQVDCTGTSNAKRTNYGYVEYCFDLYDKQLVEVSHHGHAHIVDEEGLKKLSRMIPKKKNKN